MWLSFTWPLPLLLLLFVFFFPLFLLKRPRTHSQIKSSPLCFIKTQFFRKCWQGYGCENLLPIHSNVVWKVDLWPPPQRSLFIWVLFEQQFDDVLWIRLCNSNLCRTVWSKTTQLQTHSTSLIICNKTILKQRLSRLNVTKPKNELLWSDLIQRPGQRSFCPLTRGRLDVFVSLLGFRADEWWGLSVTANNSVECRT